ncbi:hypothetical protein A9Q83_10925 [Alphaproteobacteria bacterium 46_93_T64]|nr:hypothetical protein A9Q83_10925 [Alphaproteobacteria bacterium 46_93_T64]
MQDKITHPLFESGFRIFFIAAAFYAVSTMSLWSAQMSGMTDILDRIVSMPLSIWHAHELIFGVIIAIVAGFLTTAVPVWTGTPRIRGAQLIFLFLLWFAGRIAIVFSAKFPAEIVALIDLLLIPALAFTIAKPIITQKLWRNLGFIPLLLLIMIGNTLIHIEELGWGEDTAGVGIRLSIGLLILMTVVIGGRVIPFFTQNWLDRRDKKVTTATPEWIDRVTIISCLITVVASAFPTDEFLLTTLNVLTGVLILIRLSYWQGHHTTSDPMMWILHIGYAFMGLGFLAEALSLGTDLLPEVLAQHVFTVGGLGVMILGMMSRIALGHTGRPLIIHPLITVAYLAMILSLLSRILTPLFLPDFYEAGLALAGISWVVAWVLYLIIYTPILLSPRSDGKAG